MTDAGYMCGLDGRFVGHELEGWLDHSHVLATRVAAIRPGSLSVERLRASRLPMIVERQGRDEIKLVVVHPLWRTDDARRLLGTAEDAGVRFVNTFDLERRPLKALQNARTNQPDAPMIS